MIMKKLIFSIGFIALCTGASAQTTITVPGRVSDISIEPDKTTISCDPWYRDETCLTITGGPVIIKKNVEITAFRENQPIYSRSGVVKSYDVSNDPNGISKHIIAFEK
jgi:hypothetical protein